MCDILASLAIGILTFVTQIILARILKRRRMRPERSLLIYPFAAFCAGVQFFTGAISSPCVSIFGSIPVSQFPLSATVLLIMLFVMLATFSLTPLLGEEGPTSLAQEIIRRHPGIRIEEIIRHIPDQEMLRRRFDSLVTSGYVRLEGDTYRLTGRGRRLAGMISWYFRIIGWRQSA